MIELAVISPCRSACGIHCRGPHGVGGPDCPACGAWLHSARTEPLTARRTHGGDPTMKPRPKAPARTSSPWRGKNAMPKSERGIALRSKTGAPVGRR